MRPSTIRFTRASIIVALAVFALPAISAAFVGGGCAAVGGIVKETADASPESPDGGIGISAAQFMQGGDPFAMLDRIDEVLAAGAEPSPSFAEEAGFPPGAQEARSNDDGSVVSCVLETDENEAAEAVGACLAAKGWSAVPLQGVVGATYMKGSGQLRWMLVTCTQTGEATSVVYRLDTPFYQ